MFSGVDGNCGCSTEDSRFGGPRADSGLQVQEENEADEEEEKDDVREIILDLKDTNAYISERV